ncbi:hypothetical protein VP06_07810 [Methylobacterium aquaticum]|jgi:hypothetical protein|uniref:Uncharacterized protein n=1 Tax=Methylobacterium aquaticum TaxID=270351 RepID=A0A0J6SVN3_9HYPH|nr:hypothetical protein VP06_07810 [Methylobacterium aquaticum]
MKIDSYRMWHIINKALAVAIVAMEHQHEYQSWSDLSDMKLLLEDRLEDDLDLAMYMRAARISALGTFD